MSNEEFSNSFDTALNSYSLQANFGEDVSKYNIVLNEYEKSVFLTEAVYEVFINLYNGKNIYGDFFEGTEELRRYLDTLVKTEEITTKTDGKKISDNSVIFELPSDLAFITLEQVTYNTEDDCTDGFTAKVYPVTQDEYDRVKDNPFRGPTKYKALRLDYGNNKVEIISKFPISKYFIKYLKRPNPIVLVDLPDGLEVHGESNYTECDMNELLHETILNRAVALAVQSKSIVINSKSNSSD